MPLLTVIVTADEPFESNLTGQLETLASVPEIECLVLPSSGDSVVREPALTSNFSVLHTVTTDDDPRNAALAAASGMWVTFCAAADLGSVDFHLAIQPLRDLSDPNGRVQVLSNGRFDAIARVSDLFSLPHFDNTVLIFSRSAIQTHGLTFDARVGADLRGTLFFWSYLLADDDVEVRPINFPGAIRSPLFRSGATIADWRDPANYAPHTDALARILSEVSRRSGSVTWIERAILRALVGYFVEDARLNPRTGSLSTATQEAFLASCRDLLAALPDRVLDSATIPGMTIHVRIVLRALAGKLGDIENVRVGLTDRQQGIRQLLFYSRTPAPLITAHRAAAEVPAIIAKHRCIKAFGHDVAYEGIYWFPLGGDLELRTNHRTTHRVHAKGVEAHPYDPAFAPARTAMPDLVIRPYAAATVPVPALTPASRRTPLSKARSGMRGVLRTARRAGGAARSFWERTSRWLTTQTSRIRKHLLIRYANATSATYQDSWLLMDRPNAAGDSAEHLYRHLRENHPEINAWFVLNRECPDWHRLARDGFRLVAAGSLQHSRALAGCRELICSHIHHEIVDPPAAALLKRRLWRFTFLQHGVIKEDLSRWLNDKSPSTFLTSTPQEYDSIAGRLTPYKFTAREIALTGLPRHDALVRKAATCSEDDRSLVLFMPTWRKHLTTSTSSSADFWASDFAMNWTALIASKELKRVAKLAGLQLAVIPHPDLAGFVEHAEVPDHIRIYNYASADVQSLLAHASHVVTDFSSVAFDAAIIERPIMYFQFDADTIWAGGHIGRPGYFSYEDDAFGPVTYSVDEAVATLSAMIQSGKQPAPEYLDRISRTFTRRDGTSSERVVQAILSKRRPALEWIPVAEPVIGETSTRRELTSKDVAPVS